MSKKPGLKRQTSMDRVLDITSKSKSGLKLTKEENEILKAWNQGGILAGPAKAREYMNKSKQQSDKEISDLVNLSMSNFGKDIKKSKKKFPPNTIGLREALEDCKKELSMTKSLLSQAKTKRAAHRKFGVGGRRRRTRRKRRRKKRRGGMYSPGMMQDWTGILDPNDVLKAHLINQKYLPKEMKPMAKKLVDQLMNNSTNMIHFQNRINELDKSRRRESNKQHIDGIKREINNYTILMKDIERENEKIKKKLEDLSKPSTKKVVNPGTPYRRFEGGKKRKTRKKRRKRRKRRKSRR